MLTDDIQLSLEISPNMAKLVITSCETLGKMQEFWIVSSLRYILGYACWVGTRVSLLETHLPFPAPPHHEAYPLMFQGTIHFESESAGFCFDPRYSDLPIRRDGALYN